jgi:hypothetical protein
MLGCDLAKFGKAFGGYWSMLLRPNLSLNPRFAASHFLSARAWTFFPQGSGTASPLFIRH